MRYISFNTRSRRVFNEERQESFHSGRVADSDRGDRDLSGYDDVSQRKGYKFCGSRKDNRQHDSDQEGLSFVVPE